MEWLDACLVLDELLCPWTNKRQWLAMVDSYFSPHDFYTNLAEEQIDNDIDTRDMRRSD